ncbi:hypothetical protein CCAX7_32530 [Capsulimonas corticalis]|uniref:Uncharacterized protein n=1 Tax=Capsulimonas corticalis TaxID=2219043 RepID=A0A402D405_9BACT|nr:hypothetical protein [Capsulimonas corticalis]BDI31202.1 hypothetical protein CCAX7_32530 [Capsulimonas corticalis]
MKSIHISKPKAWRNSAFVLAGAALTLSFLLSSRTNAADTGAVHAPIVFSGGHETDPRDRGRPVALVAGALGVPPDVFREAFRHVRPAPAGTRPDPNQAQRNKQALLDALSQYGVTNERLDEVSNYYRYVRSRGEMWPTKPAEGYALVKNGVVVGYVVTNGGSGYSSAPEISVPSVPGAAGKAEISFSKTDFDQNGAVSAIATAR